MAAQRLGGSIAVALRDGIDDCLMLVQCQGCPPLGSKRGARHQRHRAVQHIKLLDQIAVMAGKMDLVMKAPVRLCQRLRVAHFLAVGADHAVQDTHLFGGRMTRGKPRGQCLQLGPDGVKLGKLIVIEAGHDQAAPVTDQDRLGLQPLQRFADRRARYAETLGQLAFDQTVAGPVSAVLDGGQDQSMGIFHAGTLPVVSGIASGCVHGYLLSMSKLDIQDFANVDVWIFDLDNTLYSSEIRLFDQVADRMRSYVMRHLGLDQTGAAQLRDRYWRRYGTTLAGLMHEHDIDPHHFLDDVHDIDLGALKPDEQLARSIRALPGLKIIHTNADTPYALRVLEARGLGGFDAIWGIGETNWLPKPERAAYDLIREAMGFDPKRAAMFEDAPRNLEIPYEQGMKTILVGDGHDGPEDVPMPEAAGEHITHRTFDITGFLSALA